jgi:hypothetical protein
MGKVAGHKDMCQCPACKDPKEGIIHIRISRELENKLEQAAVKAGRTKTEVVEIVLEDYLNKVLNKGDSI